MPMPRLFGVSLCVLMVVSTFIGQLVVARPAAAASVTTTGNAELRSGPGYEHPVVSTVLTGASLSIDGPPQNEFYPVTVNGQSGWIHGAMLNFVKDTAPAPETVALAPEAGAATPPVSAWDPQQAAQEVPVGDQAATTVPVDPAVTAVPPADGGSPEAAPAPADPAAVEGTVPVDPATGATTAPPPDQALGTAVPATTPVPVSTPTPESAPTGNATVPWGTNLFQAADPSSGVVFWVPAGSTVWRLGEVSNGFVYVDYMAMIGWVAADQLTEPVAVAAEIIPESAPTAENVRTPRPGSGMAFTTVELNLRGGPSANEPSLGVVPAGKRVIMTGVMENGFHRVDYKGTLGWVASDYLSTPPDPTATPETQTAIGSGTDSRDGNRSGGSNRSSRNQDQGQDQTQVQTQETYTRDEIISIIHAAADRYGQDRADMVRVAECESALDPNAVHPSGSYGLFQFIRTTWKSTPYGDQSMFDPAANSNAAAWMWAQGRRSEWVCK